MICITARAKVNLTLEIKGRLTSGRFRSYHALESLTVFPDIGDTIEVEDAPDLSLTIKGPYAEGLDGLTDEDNLVMKAAKLLADDETRGAAITLTKNLPIASGVGGGTGDATATLQALNTLWGLNKSKEELQNLALDLGADGPVTLHGRSVMMSGIGEVLQPVKLPSFWLVLANCGKPVSTPDIFKALGADEIETPAPPSMPSLDNLPELLAYLECHANHMEPPACRLVPEIAATREALEQTSGCLISRMSGSGATCLGLFENEESARASTHALQSAHSGWWVACGEVA